MHRPPFARVSLMRSAVSWGWCNTRCAWVVLNGVLFHGLEGAQAHERHIPDLTYGPDLLQQLRGEVEPRRGGGGAAQDLGVHGLIPLLVLELLLDVGAGASCPADPASPERCLVVKADQAAASSSCSTISAVSSRCRRTVWCPCGASGPGGPDTPTPCLLSFSSSTSQMPPPGSRCPPDGRAAPGSCSKSGSRRGSGSPAGRRNGGVPWRRSPDPGSSGGGVPLLNGGLGDQLLGQVVVKSLVFMLLPSLPDTDAGEIKFKMSM